MSIPTGWNGTSRRGGAEGLSGAAALARGACARYRFRQADVAKLVDARDLKSLGPKGCAGSIPAVRTKLRFSRRSLELLAEKISLILSYLISIRSPAEVIE